MSEEERIRKRLNLEEGVNITAGTLNLEAFYAKVEAQKTISPEQAPFALMLGLIINMSRTNLFLTLEQLASKTNCEVLELQLIEEGCKIPEPRLVSKLARALNILPGKLMQLAGHVKIVDRDVASATAHAYAYAANSNLKPLAKSDREALQDFVKALAE